MSELLLHPQSQARLQAYLNSPPHAVLVSGAAGSGKGAVARYLACHMLGMPAGLSALSDKCLVITPVKQAISIDAVRSLKMFSKLRVPGNRPIRRVVVVEDADSLTIEAQNALLKLLEEPPVDMAIILTASNPATLLPTVRSRTQHLGLVNPTKQQVFTYFQQQGHQKETLERVYQLADGRVGLMAALLGHDASHPLKTGLDEAKQLLASSVFERLLRVDELSKQPEKVMAMAQAMSRIAAVSLRLAAEREDAKQLAAWQRRLKLLRQARVNLGRHANPRLVLTHLLLNL